MMLTRSKTFTRTFGSDFTDAKKYLTDKITRDLKSSSSNHKDRLTGISWHDLHFNDLRALFEKDMSYTTKSGVNRLSIVNAQYNSKLSRIHSFAPCGSSFRVLCHPHHKSHFSNHFVPVLQENTSVIEKIAGLRKSILTELPNIARKEVLANSLIQSSLSLDEAVEQMEIDSNLKHRANGNLHHSDFENVSEDLANRLNALTNWQLPK
jgi:hypothetical protein